LKQSPIALLLKRNLNDRFVLRYTTKKLGITDIETTLEKQLLVSDKKQTAIDYSFAGAIDKIIIYDVAGRRVYLKTNVDSQERW
jgi:hypothetical protein